MGDTKSKNEFDFVFWFHLLVIVLIWLSPFLVSWKIILLGIVLYYLQLIVVGDCILTKKQFNTKVRETTFYYHYLTKLGFRLNARKVKFVADYVMPWIILGIALIWQVVFIS